MEYIKITDTLDRVKTYGRAFLDEEGGVLYSNYTCGGFEILFRGSTLSAEFSAIPDTFVPPGAPPFPGRTGPGSPYFWTAPTRRAGRSACATGIVWCFSPARRQRNTG